MASSVGVLWRWPSTLFSSADRYSAHSTGSAHGREANGNFTLIAKVTHLCPQTQTVWLWVVQKTGTQLVFDAEPATR